MMFFLSPAKELTADFKWTHVNHWLCQNKDACVKVGGVCDHAQESLELTAARNLAHRVKLFETVRKV